MKLISSDLIMKIKLGNWYFVTIIVLNYCEKNLSKCNFEFFQGTRKVSREICNVFEIHFSWPQYPGKIQNYTRTNFSHSSSEQLW